MDIVVISEPYRQLPYWFNDMAGVASLWITLYNGRQAMSGTKICGNGMVGVMVESTMCISGYCSPNLRKEEFERYMEELESVIKEGKTRAPQTMVAVTSTRNLQCEEVGSRSREERICWMQSRGT